MPTIEEITEKFENYSDEKLLEVYNAIDQYTDDGKIALNIVLKKRGGIEAIKLNLKNQAEIENEIKRIKFEIKELVNRGRSKVEIKEKIVIKNIKSLELERLIEEVSESIQSEEADLKVSSRTILGSLFGGFIGGTIGGILWGLQMVFSKHIFYIFGFGLAILSYGFIRLFTIQSNKNTVFLVMTIISVLYALFLGQVIYDIFGGCFPNYFYDQNNSF